MMNIDVSSTKSKEAFVQAELYRILRNMCVVPSLGPPLINFSGSKAWSPKDVLIEARVSGKRKRLDLVLIGEKETEQD